MSKKLITFTFLCLCFGQALSSTCSESLKLENHQVEINYQIDRIETDKSSMEYIKKKKPLIVYQNDAIFIKNDLKHFIQKVQGDSKKIEVFKIPIHYKRTFKDSHLNQQTHVLALMANKNMKSKILKRFNLNPTQSTEVFLTWNEELRKMYYLDHEYYNNEVINIDRYVPVEAVITNTQSSAKNAKPRNIANNSKLNTCVLKRL